LLYDVAVELLYDVAVELLYDVAVELLYDVTVELLSLQVFSSCEGYENKGLATHS